MKQLFTKSFLALGTIAGGILITTLASAAITGNPWTGPSQAPPLGNTPTPLNVSIFGQVKEGGLLLNTAGAVNGLIVGPSTGVVTCSNSATCGVGKVGIGISDPCDTRASGRSCPKLAVQGIISSMGNVIQDVATPVLGTDAVNKDYIKDYVFPYVDAAVAGSGGGGSGPFTLYGVGVKNGGFPPAGDGVQACPAGYNSIAGYGPHGIFVDRSLSYARLEVRDEAVVPPIQSSVTAEGGRPITLPASVVGTYSVCSGSRTHVLHEQNGTGLIADACIGGPGGFSCNTCRICVPQASTP